MAKLLVFYLSTDAWYMRGRLFTLEAHKSWTHIITQNSGSIKRTRKGVFHVTTRKQFAESIQMSANTSKSSNLVEVPYFEPIVPMSTCRSFQAPLISQNNLHFQIYSTCNSKFLLFVSARICSILIL